MYKVREKSETGVRFLVDFTWNDPWRRFPVSQPARGCGLAMAEGWKVSTRFSRLESKLVICILILVSTSIFAVFPAGYRLDDRYMNRN